MNENKEQGISLLSPAQLRIKLNQSLCTPIGINSVYALVKSKNFPSIKIGGKYYVVESKLPDWLNSQFAKRKT